MLHAVMQHEFMGIWIDTDNNAGILDDLLLFGVRDQSKESLLRFPILIYAPIFRDVSAEIRFFYVLARCKRCAAMRCLHQKRLFEKIHTDHREQQNQLGK